MGRRRKVLITEVTRHTTIYIHIHKYDMRAYESEVANCPTEAVLEGAQVLPIGAVRVRVEDILN